MSALSPVATSVRYDYWGSLMKLTCTINTVSDGDPFAPPGFTFSDNAVANPTTTGVVTPKVSGNTITFGVASGSPNLTVTVWGQ
jgi:hypothetical protein